jgi:hypothetical protein
MRRLLLMTLGLAALVSSLTLVAGCDNERIDGTDQLLLPAGVWAGESWTLQVSRDGTGRLQGVCSSGTAQEPIHVASGGQVDFAFSFMREVGPAPHATEAAAFSGTLERKVLRGTVTIAGEAVPFDVKLGATPHHLDLCR